MGEILDRGSLLFASSRYSRRHSPSAPAGHVLHTATCCSPSFTSPVCLFLAILIARLGAFANVFRRDYSPLLTCAAMA